MSMSTVQSLAAGVRPEYVTAGWLALNHTSRHLEAWMENHHDPKWKPKKRNYRPRKIRSLTPSQWRRIEYEWEWERQRQVNRHGEPTHVPLDPNRVVPKHRKVVWVSV